MKFDIKILQLLYYQILFINKIRYLNRNSKDKKWNSQIFDSKLGKSEGQ